MQSLPYFDPKHPEPLLKALVGAAREAILCLGKDGKVLAANGRFFELVGWSGPYQGQGFEALKASWMGRASDPLVVEDYFARCLGPQPPEGPVELQPVAGQMIEARFERLPGPDGQTYRAWYFEEWRTSALAWVSHEIKNPLNAVLGFSELLSEAFDQGPPVSEPVRESLRGLRIGAKHLQSVLGDLLDFSRLEAGVVEPRPEWFSPSRFLDEVGDLYRARFLRRGLDFRVTAPEGPEVEILADQGRLAQILGNLLSNALKFTRRGSVHLELARRGEAWEFAVADTGIGVPPDQQETIFEPFVQRQGQDPRRFGGSGLGLAICRTLTQSLGGRLALTSRPGEGSRFSVTFPTFEVRSPEASAPLPEVVPLGPGPQLLVVDDERTTHLLVQGFLRGTGIRVLSAYDGTQAVDLYRAHRPPWVLLDLRMPGWDGPETARRLLGLPGAENLVILAMSAAEPQATSSPRPWKDFLEKPFGKQVLLKFLSNHLTFVDDTGPRP